MKSLVVYFSRAGENSVNGNIEVIEKGYTEILAQKIAKYTDSHIFKLEPVVPYPFSYVETVKRSNEEGFVDYLHPEFKVDEYELQKECDTQKCQDDRSKNRNTEPCGHA